MAVINVAVTGDLETAAEYRLQPTGARSAKTATVGWAWRRRYTLTNGGAQPLANYPWALDIGRTDGLVAASPAKALASGDDLRVVVAGQEWARTLVDWNSATQNTLVWVVLPRLDGGASLTVEVWYGNASAGSPPTLTAGVDLPAFDVSTGGAGRSTNSLWVYQVNQTAAAVSRGAWHVAPQTSLPAAVGTGVPGAWAPALTLGVGAFDDASQEQYSSYTVSGTTYWHGRLQARRSREGTIVARDLNEADGVAISSPLGFSSAEFDLLVENDLAGNAANLPIGQVVVLGRNTGQNWVPLWTNSTNYDTPTTVPGSGTQTVTPAAAVTQLAFAVWPYDNVAISPSARGDRKVTAAWKTTLKLGVNGALVTQATAQAETAVYELAATVRAEQDGAGARQWAAIRLGNATGASGALTPRLAVELNQVVRVWGDRRRGEVWDAALAARVEGVPTPALTAVDGVSRDGTTAEQAAAYWLPLTPTANPLANPSFAADASGWERGTVTAGITVAAQARDASVFDSSPAALKTEVTASTAASGSVVEDRAADLLPTAGRGRVWFAAAVRSTSANLQPTLTVWFYDASGAAVGAAVREADWTVTANAWGRRVFAAAVPEGATQFRVGVTQKTKAANVTGSAWVDTVTVLDNDLTVTDVSAGTVVFGAFWTPRYA